MTPPAFSVLSAFLANPARSLETLSYHETQGFLFAVASCPEPVAPSEWIPQVFGDDGADYDTPEQANDVLRELMALYNGVNVQVLEGSSALPADVEVRWPPLANLENETPLSQWSRGFLTGHQWLEESWDHAMPDDVEEEFGASFMVLSFFASAVETTEFFSSGDHGDLGKVAEDVCRLLPEAMRDYARLGRAIGQALLEFGQPAPARSEKIGRNEPCPCGSGKKFKRCCGAVN